jgi:6-phosphogluconate dehydrogenase
MQLGMIGLGRMGANMVRRLMRGGHPCVVQDVSADAVEGLAKEGATGSSSIADFLNKLSKPRTVCLMVPAAIVDSIIDQLTPRLDRDDAIIDGGNSHYHDDIARARRLQPKGIHYVDMGTSGGVWGLERGYCLMIGGEADVVKRLDPMFKTLAPGPGDIPGTPGREKLGGTAENGYLHCGPSGAGHFVKMVHNGIEYGLMAAYAEGLSILKHADIGKRSHEKDAETTPLRNPEHYQYDFNLADITELWRRGGVISSWLLDLTAQAFADDRGLEKFGGTVSDSGEGRWTVAAANDEGVPAVVLTAALFERFASRNLDLFQNKMAGLAAALRRWRLQRRRYAREAASGAAGPQQADTLPRNPAEHVPPRGRPARSGQLHDERTGHRREAVRPRPRICAGAQPRAL